MSDGARLGKAEMARRQLGTSLALFLQDADPISVHTLACSGGEHAAFLARQRGQEPFSSHVMATFPDMKLRDVQRLRSKYCNAIKHPTKQNGDEHDTEAVMEGFSDVTNEHHLFVAWYDYMLGVGSLPLEAQAFQLWYFSLHPDVLADDNSDWVTAVEKFAGIAMLSRAEQKRALRETIERYGGDNELRADPRTDARPLVLGRLPS